jgi:hypothetical protein
MFYYIIGSELNKFVKTLFLLVLVMKILYKYIGATGPAGLDGVLCRNGTSELAGSSRVLEWNIRK